MPSKKLITIFWLLVLTKVVALLFGFLWLHHITKPLLMPALLLLLFQPAIVPAGKKLIVTALVFSWMGDSLLLFESRHALFFISGLVSFFFTHTCYIIYFLSTRSEAPSLLKKQPIYILPIICYGAGLVWLLYPYLGALKIPVVFYALVICIMLLCSIHIYLKIKGPANKYFILGAALFVLSDSILAVNKFYQPLPFAGTMIMLSYCAAQFFIVWGVLKR